jgi:hypothetical protein
VERTPVTAVASDSNNGNDDEYDDGVVRVWAGALPTPQAIRQLRDAFAPIKVTGTATGGGRSSKKKKSHK